MALLPKTIDDLFDSILNLGDLQIINRPNYDQRVTPLMLAVQCGKENYAQRLLEMGADPNIPAKDGTTPLHWVHSTNMAKLLIEKGADVDAQTMRRETPILQACRERRDNILHLLLYYGADPTIADNDFGTCLLHAIQMRNTELQRVLLPYFTSDGNRELPLMYFFYTMMPNRSEIFPQLYDSCSKIIYTEDQLDMLVSQFFLIDANYFKMFIVKFKYVLVDMFEYARSRRLPVMLPREHMKNNISIINTFDENDLLTEAVALQFRHNAYFMNFRFITDNSLSYDEKTQLALSLVSHGLPLTFESMYRVYTSFGYCELFRILLHCDIDYPYSKTFFSTPCLLVLLIVDVRLHLEFLLHTEDINLYISEKYAVELLEQFALSKLQQFCIIEFKDNEAIQSKLRTLPSVPKLVELARNAARRHIVDTCQMTCSRHLYTYIDHFEISQVYKDILSFKTKLYL